MIVPHGDLAPETLAAVIEEYVTRDGTEASDAADKVADVRRALARGDLVLVFDPDSETCTFAAPDGLPGPDELRVADDA